MAMETNSKILEPQKQNIFFPNIYDFNLRVTGSVESTEDDVDNFYIVQIIRGFVINTMTTRKHRYELLSPSKCQCSL